MSIPLPQFTLTKAEYELIHHRLTAYDCLADCLHEEYADGNLITDRQAHDYVESVAYGLETWTRQHVEATGCVVINVGGLSPLEVDILRDCVDGSTFFCGAEDEVALGHISRGKLLSWHRAAKSVAAKMRAAGIHTTGFPTC